MVYRKSFIQNFVSKVVSKSFIKVLFKWFIQKSFIQNFVSKVVSKSFIKVLSKWFIQKVLSKTLYPKLYLKLYPNTYIYIRSQDLLPTSSERSSSDLSEYTSEYTILVRL